MKPTKLSREQKALLERQVFDNEQPGPILRDFQTAGDPRVRGELGIPADEFKLNKVLTRPGQTMDLTYDFGDCWRFTILLERIEPPGTIKKVPKLLTQFGKAPRQYGSPDEW